MTTPEPTFTLAEAERILARRECDRDGHELSSDTIRGFRDAVTHVVTCQRCKASFEETR